MFSSISEITHLWDRVLTKIEEKLNDRATFSSFFDGSYIEEIRGNTIVVVVNTALAAQLMRGKYYDIIQESVSEVTESNFQLEFLGPDDVDKNRAEHQVKSKREAKYFQNSYIDPKLTFDNFVVGSFNREASQAALLIAKNPGKMFNPLFIHSNSGLGKTHLMHAIGNYVNKNGNPNAKVLYITAEDFVEEYVKYVRAEVDGESLKDYFKGVDILLLDDVQFLADRVKTEEMFFVIYNNMISAGKQIVITSDKHPNELKKLEERLVTRFNQGLVVKINEPDQNTCVEILKKKIQNNGLDINSFDEEVIDFIASKFSRDVRELEGALNRLIFYVISIHQTDRITLDIAVEAVSSLVGGKQIATEVNEQKIISIVADYYNLTPSHLTGKIRTGQIALARHIAMYLIREILDVPLKKIGAAFGGKDHTTVMSAIQKVEKELKTDEKLKEAVDELRKRIGK
ncbi:MAG: chromosomal replication initiator protein DnaA [Bacilli bacterium]|nr:chromosomal replication initiator protein DnaA [Bacilli bacterium]